MRTTARAPAALAARMVGSAATIRCVEVIAPSFIGTLKSTRISLCAARAG